MSRPWLARLVIAFALLVGLVGFGASPVSAQDGDPDNGWELNFPWLALSPTPATVNTEITVRGSNWTPGEQLIERFVYDEGDTFRMPASDRPAGVTVGADGTFAFTFLPARDFARVASGVWVVEFCRASDAKYCVVTAFFLSE